MDKLLYFVLQGLYRPPHSQGKPVIQIKEAPLLNTYYMPLYVDHFLPKENPLK